MPPSVFIHRDGEGANNIVGYMKIRTSDNSVIRSFLFCVHVHEYGKILSKYSIQNLCSGTAELKRSL